MAEMWTDEQIKAISAKGKGTVVPAAAGSGKTAVLIERAIRILSDEENKVPADTLLCVTFTNAAAAQLREKLTNALGEQAAKYPENSWLAQQQSKLQTARIVTINAFCLELVKNNAHAMGLQSDLRIMEENDSLLLRKEMLEKAVDAHYEDFPEKMELLHKKFSTKKRDIINAAEIMYLYLRSIPFSDEYMQDSLEKLRSDDGCLTFGNMLLKQSIENCHKASAYIEQCIIIAERYSYDVTVDVLGSDLEVIEDVEKALLKGYSAPDLKERYTSLYEMPGNVKFATIKYPTIDKNDKAQLEQQGFIKEQIKKRRDKAKDRIRNIRDDLSGPFEEVTKDCKISADIIETLYGIVKQADELISEEKKERSCCDFADVELMTVSLLAEKENGVISRTGLCKELVDQGEFGVIMIDEYQDTNKLQELIFKCLSNTEDPDIFGTNVFIVGDIKQAIYQFRRSDPKLFAAARAAAADERYKDKLQEIVLTQNFRSRQNIINTANFMFSRLMSKTVGEVDYVSGERLNYGAKKCYDTKDDLPARLAVCSKEHEFDEAARIIKEMLLQGVLVYDKDIKARRACRPSDFCILTRTNKVNLAAAQALGKYGLKVASREISGYLLSREVSLMTSLLKVIDDPLNDTAMLAVMLSPIFQFTDEEAAKLKISAKSNTANFYGIMTEFSKNDEDKALAEKCENALQKIRRYRYLACAMSMSRLIRKLYTETNFYILSASLSGGERSQANLRLLLDIADGYDSNSTGGLSGFIRYFDDITENGKDFSQAALATETNDAVNVMTMHKSKGLEFPFVILTQLDNEFLSEKRDSIVLNEYGIGIKITDSELLARYYTVPFTALTTEKERETISEAMRLLYVSVTRAREQLILMIPTDENEDEKTADNANKMIMRCAKSGCITPETALSAKCMLDWVLTVFAYHSGREKLTELLGLDCSVIDDVSDECDILISCENEALKINDTQKSAETAADKDLVKKLASSIASPQPKQLPDEAKLSVTDIVHKRRESGAFKPRASSEEKRQGLSAAERGTLTHRFMELCDIKNAAADFDGEFDRVMSLGRFSPQEADQIYLDALKKFFNSDIAKRMAASDEILRERQFLVKISDMALDKELFSDIAGSDGMLQGVADCVFKEGGGYVLVDYKTDKVSSADVLSQRYSRQLQLYRAALDIILDAPVKECVICSLYLGAEITV